MPSPNSNNNPAMSAHGGLIS